MKILKFVGLLIACAIAFVAVGLFLGFFAAAFVDTPPVTSSDYATWAGALGSMGAIVAAWLGIRAQLRAAAASINESQLLEQRNTLLGLAAELSTYLIALKSVRQYIDDDYISASLNGIEMVFPVVNPTFHVFSGCAGRIGVISEDVTRTNVIGAYANLEMFFTLMNQNSQAVIKGMTVDSFGDPNKELLALFPLINDRASSLIKTLEFVIEELHFRAKNSV